jgi:hypothetical protein
MSAQRWNAEEGRVPDRLSTVELIESLALGKPGALKARPDGTVLDGHHRIVVLRERGVSVDAHPREVVPQEVGE